MKSMDIKQITIYIYIMYVDANVFNLWSKKVASCFKCC